MKKIIFYLCLSIAIISSFQSIKIYAKAVVAQHLIASAWTQTQDTGRTVKPWAWADTSPILKLTLSNKKAHYVLQGMSGQALAFGPAHLSASALPGNNQEIIIAAHRDTHFRSVKNIQLGEELTLENRHKKQFQYRVVSTRIVDTREEKLWINEEQEILRLITCYPFDAVSPRGPLRYEVIAIPHLKEIDQHTISTAL